MSACTTCGKCPCYEHERTTVMVTDGVKAKHSEKMAELRGLYYDPSEPPRIGKFATDALAYADSLAAERDELATKHAIVCECVKVVDGANESLRRQLWAAEEKLRAAEREAFALRIWSELVCYVGASPADQDNFAQHMSSERPPNEWRFSGSLGFGGIYPAEMVVRCYPEDETPDRLAAIRNANVALARLAKRHGKALSAYDATNQDSRVGAGEGVG